MLIHKLLEEEASDADSLGAEDENALFLVKVKSPNTPEASDPLPVGIKRDPGGGGYRAYREGFGRGRIKGLFPTVPEAVRAYDAAKSAQEAEKAAGLTSVGEAEAEAGGPAAPEAAPAAAAAALAEKDAELARLRTESAARDAQLASALQQAAAAEARSAALEAASAAAEARAARLGASNAALRVELDESNATMERLAADCPSRCGARVRSA